MAFDMDDMKREAEEKGKDFVDQRFGKDGQQGQSQQDNRSGETQQRDTSGDTNLGGGGTNMSDDGMTDMDDRDNLNRRDERDFDDIA